MFIETRIIREIETFRTMGLLIDELDIVDPAVGILVEDIDMGIPVDELDL